MVKRLDPLNALFCSVLVLVVVALSLGYKASQERRRAADLAAQLQRCSAAREAR